MIFFKFKDHINPLFALCSAFLILIIGLVTASSITCSYFLLGTYVWLIIFGCYKEAIKTLPLFIIFGGGFALIAYFVYGNSVEASLAMANRFGAVFVTLIVGMSVQPVCMTRNLSQLHTPRGITLGMLVTMSFVPVLKAEISRVREAMKTRGAGSLLNPKIFYRAFLIPLVTRLADISDTLSLSIETRGFTLDKVPFTVYKKEYINAFDIIFILGLFSGAIASVIL
ncbi:MAG: energy-coupling factor transporter transmembrane component T family protein [Bacilli bacterium]